MYLSATMEALTAAVAVAVAVAAAASAVPMQRDPPANLTPLLPLTIQQGEQQQRSQTDMSMIVHARMAVMCVFSRLIIDI
jgi:hypothetical protein